MIVNINDKILTATPQCPLWAVFWNHGENNLITQRVLYFMVTIEYCEDINEYVTEETPILINEYDAQISYDSSCSNYLGLSLTDPPNIELFCDNINGYFRESGHSMHLVTYNGYAGLIKVSNEDGSFVGHLVGISDIVGFHAETADEMQAVFQEAVDDYLETCAKAGIKPKQP